MKVSITDQQTNRVLLSNHVIDDPATMVFEVKQILESKYPKEYPMVQQILWIESARLPILEEEGSCDQRAQRKLPNISGLDIAGQDIRLDDTRMLIDFVQSQDDSCVFREERQLLLNDSKHGPLSPVNLSLRTPTATSSASVRGARQNNSILGIFSPKNKTPKKQGIPTTASKRQFTMGSEAQNSSFTLRQESFERSGYPHIRLKVSLCDAPINLNLLVLEGERKRSQQFQVFESTQIFSLKVMIQKQLRIPLQFQVLSYMRHSVDNGKSLKDCLHGSLQTPQLKGKNFFNFQISRRNMGRNAMEHNFKSSVNFINRQPQTLNLTLTVLQRIGGSKFNIGIDLTFNAIKQVRKIGWKKEAPEYRDVEDGMCWCCYCMDKRCRLYKQLFMIKKGYGNFNLLNEFDHRQIRCPMCRTTNVQVRNMGFVKCEWAIKACYREGGNLQSFIGKTYDNRLHTLKESNLKEIWKFLEVQVSELPKGSCQNKDPGSALKIQDALSLCNLPSVNGEAMVEAQTAARKIFFEDFSIVPKVNSNPPSPEPEGNLIGYSDIYEQPRRREESKRKESELIRPNKKQSKPMNHFLQNIEEMKQSSPKRASCSCAAPQENKCSVF